MIIIRIISVTELHYPQKTTANISLKKITILSIFTIFTFKVKIGCISVIQASLITLDLHYLCSKSEDRLHLGNPSKLDYTRFALSLQQNNSKYERPYFTRS